MSEIERIMARVHDLSSSVNRWNNAYMIFVAFTVVLAVGVFITQFVAGQKGKLLSAAQDALITEKDRIAAADSKEKDGKIADALKTAGASNEAAGTANKKAAEANERSSALEVEALRLREQLSAQGPRENLLRGEKRQRLVDALKPFAGQRIDIRNSASVIQVQGKNVMSTPIGDDTLSLAVALTGVAKDAGWEAPPEPLPASVVNQGIQVLVARDASQRTIAAAMTLVRALIAVPFGKVSGPFAADSDRIARVGNDPALPAFDKDTIVVEILTHP